MGVAREPPGNARAILSVLRTPFFNARSRSRRSVRGRLDFFAMARQLTMTPTWVRQKSVG